MSRFITKKDDTYLEKIESMEECKWKINEVCCNDKSECLGDYCIESKESECFVKEDGIVGGV